MNTLLEMVEEAQGFPSQVLKPVGPKSHLTYPAAGPLLHTLPSSGARGERAVGLGGGQGELY